MDWVTSPGLKYSLPSLLHNSGVPELEKAAPIVVPTHIIFGCEGVAKG